ncbi:hypothetical protein CAOG_09091 [Capsaspora owczarzaki ATCC 30864]|uniref:RRM domain-containing protein n=1 Tax=Capsaspora owczarzaki (strain ATCC 30864) TaxID=595528 RepID=A0A0D2X5C9_CAPO3|nr:hypothetical protein CAOG_09091 [Capsaspora owczarzaki ATCC 30864]KJE97589.1 hypothetical protein, variant 1 [Capsaspora owczarzaki ATCC 30864]|eukprot:XP_011270824.1 hypothetical protein CAOG_09091 [Capsaspora owczarzaki ATCC 30864]
MGKPRPMDVDTDSTPDHSHSRASGSNAAAAAAGGGGGGGGRKPFVESDDVRKSAATLFIRGLPFAMNNAQLEAAFSDVAPVKTAFVVTEKGTKDKCRGFGFVQFALKDDALKAIETMNGKSLGGKIISVDLANKRHRGDPRKEAREAAAAAAGEDASSVARPAKSLDAIVAAKPVGQRVVFDDDGNKQHQSDDDEDDEDEDDEEDEKPAPKPEAKKPAKADKADKAAAKDAAASKKSEKTTPAMPQAKEAPKSAESSKSEKPSQDAASKKTAESKSADSPASKPDAPSTKKRETKPPAATSKPSKSDQASSVARPQSKESRTVVIKGLSANITQKILYKRMRKVGDVEETIYPFQGDITVGHVVYTMHKNAEAAVAALNAHEFKGNHVIAVLKTRERFLDGQLSAKALRKCRLIVRNLPFNVTRLDIEKAFRKYGPIKEIALPLKPDGVQLKGFAFVQFTNYIDAANAVAGMNNQPINGRPVAVDFAVAKDKFEELKQQQAADQPAEASAKMDVDDASDSDSNEDNEEEEEEDEDEDEEENEEEDLSDDEDLEAPQDDEDDDGELDEFDDDDSDDDDDEDEDDGEDDNKATESRPKFEKHDVGQGQTVFIRNLAYDTDEEALQERFKEFGPISYTRICYNADNGLSKGVGFVQFKSKDGADKCLASSSSGLQLGGARPSIMNDSGIVLDGRTLSVALAVERNEAKQLMDSNTKKREAASKLTDKRNLYLAREGTIDPNSEIALTLSKTDLAKRAKAEQEKRAKLKNPNYFVSTTRLSIRNLPTTVDEKALKQLIHDAVKKSGALQTAPSDGKKPRQVKVVQAKIVRSKDRVDADGVGRSTGFGFTELRDHAHALAALRYLNNNPDIFGREKRPIVEFAVENQLALQKREQMLTKLKSRRKEEGGSASKEEGKGKFAGRDRAKGKDAHGDKPETKGKFARKDKPADQPANSSAKFDNKGKGKGKFDKTKSDDDRPKFEKGKGKFEGKPKFEGKGKGKPATEEDPAAATATPRGQKRRGSDAGTAAEAGATFKRARQDAASEESGDASSRPPRGQQQQGGRRNDAKPQARTKTQRPQKGGKNAGKPNKKPTREEQDEAKLEGLIAKYRSSFTGTPAPAAKGAAKGAKGAKGANTKAAAPAQPPLPTKLAGSRWFME